MVSELRLAVHGSGGLVMKATRRRLVEGGLGVAMFAVSHALLLAGWAK